MNPSTDLAEFIGVVAGDEALRRTLSEEKSDEAFADACAVLATERSLRVDADEVRELLRVRTMLWHQRHIL